MKYDNVFHLFIEAMIERTGVAPNHWEHHVFVRYGDIIGFAYFDEKSWKWIVPSIYANIALNEMDVVVSLLMNACADYSEANNIPKDRPLPEMPDVRPFVVIQEAKQSDDFEEVKWGIEENDSDHS